MATKIEGPIGFKYFDLGKLGGRGGTVRFFCLLTGIELKETLVSFPEWSVLKQQLVESGENPAAHLPVLTLPNGEILTEHHAIMRRFSRLLGLYGLDIEKDYATDRFADATVEFRWSWVAAALGDDATKEKYVKEKRAGLYKLMETFLERSGGQGAHALGDSFTFVDALLFGQLWDDSQSFGDDLLQQHPRLMAFYQAFRAQPAISKWCEAAAAKA